ncbi:MAG: anthranilate phosphoribosyltransferase [SAR202 cluster bacterium Io17-Chloro-G9]|nr:MAG: anthranilate phosphoribosyltransferase [SAR202 cluster bacterium Io17-Chloro-G9]
MDIREAISVVVEGRSLTVAQSSAVMRQMMQGDATPAQLGAFLTALRLKGESTEEIAGMATVMREFSLKVRVDGPLVDSVGTGGDGQNTFNISTAAAFVAAGAGLRVAKHGNRAASGSCGAADVLEALGVRIELPPEGVERCINEGGIGFMFAPAFHPSMRHAGPTRREIGIRTVFNILGPLTNPAGVQSLLIGVAFPELGEKMAEVMRLLGTRHAIVVHGAGGLDELSLSGDNFVWEVKEGKVRNWTLSVDETSLPQAPVDAIRGGDKEQNAATMRRLLQGDGGPIRDAVLLNSAGVLMAADLVSNVKDGIQSAAQAIDSGAALAKLDGLIELSQADS